MLLHSMVQVDLAASGEWIKKLAITRATANFLLTVVRKHGPAHKLGMACHAVQGLTEDLVPTCVGQQGADFPAGIWGKQNHLQNSVLPTLLLSVICNAVQGLTEEFLHKFGQRLAVLLAPHADAPRIQECIQQVIDEANAALARQSAPPEQPAQPPRPAALELAFVHDCR